MPLVRLEVRNEYRLGDPELYKGALKKDDPKALLEGVAVAGLVGILRQLGDLAEYAADVFHDLHEQVTVTAARGRKIMKKIQNIEAALPLVEKAIKGQTSHIHFSYVSGSEWHAHLVQEKSLLSSELPRFMMESYEECRDPPRLYLLDKFDHAGAGVCMKRYSDPSYFKRALALSEQQNPENLQREKKVKKMKRKGSRFRNCEVPLAFHISRCDSRMRFASKSIDDLTDMRLNSEILSESTSPNIRNKINNAEQPSNTNPVLVPDELEFSEVSIPNLHVKDSSFDASFQHDEPSIGLDDTSQNESLQEQSVPRSSSVTWDEKTEIIKPSSPISCDDIPIDKIQDSELLNVKSQHLTLEHAKIEALNQEGITLALSKPPVLLSNNHFDEVTSETDNYMDALNTLESETETEAEFQTKRELKSNFNFFCEGPESKTVSTHKPAMQNPDSSEVEAFAIPEISLNYGSFEIISNFIPSDSSGQAPFHAADSFQTEKYVVMNDSSESSIHLITENKVCRGRNDEASLNCRSTEIISNFIPSDSSGQVPSDSVQTERYVVTHESSESSIHLITENKVSRGRNDETSLNYGSLEVISNFIPSDSSGQVPSHAADIVETERYVAMNDSSESSIHLITGNKVSRGRNDVLCQDLTTSHNDPAPKASTEHASSSVIPSVQLWTNAGLFGVQPSKPPDLGPLNASNENSAFAVTYSAANYSSNIGNFKTVAGFDEDDVDALTSSVHGNRSNAQLSAGTYDEIQLNDPLKYLLYHENEQDDMDIQQASKVRLQRPLSLSQFDKTQEPSISSDNSSSKQYTAENNIWSGAPFIATSSSQLQNSQPSLITKNISSSFSDLAQRFLANTLQRKTSLTNANTYTSYGLSTANISKAEETSRLNNHEEMASEAAVQESYVQFAKETVTRGSVKMPPSPHYSEQSSPPLEHMKISFHPMNSFEMSRMKLELSSDSLYENDDDLILPSFHLLQGHVDQNSGSESDDDTFCRSCPYSSDDLLSPHSFSNSELWEHDERNGDMDYELCDASYRISSTLPSISGYEHNSRKDILRGSKHVDADDSRIAFQSKPFVDLPRIDALLSLRNKEGCRDYLSNNLISSEANLNNMPTPLPPPPLERTLNQLVSSEESINNKDGINHLIDIETLRYLPKQQEQHPPSRTPNISGQDQQKMGGHQKLKHHGDIKEADKSEELLLQIREEPQQHDQRKLNKQAKPNTRSADDKELDEREELLHQIRNKSFNLRRTTRTTSNASPARSNASATIGNVAAILEKATAIRQAFVGSDEVGDEDNWSDG